uniref:DOG1 domain-containing protein n=1 Tax=Oryza punctata TaxID=4537 RepID=A0A0E0L341_ORYPU
MLPNRIGLQYKSQREEAKKSGKAREGSQREMKGYLAARPPTLEIFPSWPMSQLQEPYSNSQSVGSTTDSSSAQNTMSQAELVSPASMRSDSGQEQQQQETERRLAQNREAARKSRLRKKAYVQQLETSRIRLQQIEQELQRARSQVPTLRKPHKIATSNNTIVTKGAAMFDMEYTRWLDDDSKCMAELQGALQAQLPDGNLGAIVEECMRHYDELFHLRAVLASSDVFHLMTGMWAAPAERCFLWMAGFRPSEILKMLIPQLDPLTEQQLMGMCSLQQSSEQTEEALAQGLHQLHQSLADAVGGGPLNDGADVANYTGLMALALGRLENLESFYRQKPHCDRECQPDRN